MSNRSHRKGYEAEHAIECILQMRYPDLAPNILRPRAGSARDKGDIHGLPVVISVKNVADLRLAEWVDGMIGMCDNADKAVGVVWHKRYRTGHPAEWYVTTTEPMARLLLAHFPGPFLAVKRIGLLRGRNALTEAMRDLDGLMVREDARAGILRHVRKPSSSSARLPADYVTMMGRCFLTVLDTYITANPTRLRVVV